MPTAFCTEHPRPDAPSGAVGKLANGTTISCASRLASQRVRLRLPHAERRRHTRIMWGAIAGVAGSVLSGAMGGGGGGGGLLGGIGGMVGKAINGVLGGFGGKLGEKLGGLADKITGGIMGLVGNVMGKHGEENTSNALQNETSQSMGNAIKIVINNNNEIPQAIKDQAGDAIDNAVGGDAKPTTCECQSEVHDVIGDAINDMTDAIAEEGKEEADKSSEGEGGGAQNWLVALAKALAGMQNQFLSQAMENMDTMKANAEGASGDEADSVDMKTEDANMGEKSEGAEEGEKTDEAKQKQTESREKFLEAQSEYQANMKMFGMAAEATSNTLKTVGDALASLSRKQ